MPENKLKSAVCFLALTAGASVTLYSLWLLWRKGRKRQKILKQYNIKDKTIHIVDTAEQWENVFLILSQHLQSQKVLGLDCEWVQRKKVALLQLATTQGLCVLVRLFKMSHPIPSSLKSLLADRSILKVGVAVVDDGKKLHHDYGIQVMGCVDLRHLLKRVRGAFSCQSRGLRGLAQGVLHVNISKDITVRCGNWEAETYTQEQIDYAATDAAVAVDIFVEMVHAKIQISSLPPNKNDPGAEDSVSGEEEQANECSQKQQESLELRKAVTNSGIEKESAEENKENHCIHSQNSQPLKEHKRVVNVNSGEKDLDDTVVQNLITNNSYLESNDLPSLQKSYMEQTSFSESVKVNNSISEWSIHESKSSGTSDCQLDAELFWKSAKSMCQGIVDAGYVFNAKNGGLPQPKMKKNNGSQKDPTDAYSTRRRPLWDNCRLEAPDGKALCTCDLRKAQWYLDKGLGEKVCDDPLTVRLLFEPANRPQSERNYYLQVKENICVVCGHDKDYIRKFVIPFEYRKYFPAALKDHSSHDVLLLCTTCHRKSCDFDSSMRFQLAEECGAPVESGASSKTVLDHDLQRVRSAGRALKVNKSSIPEHRIKELEKILLDFFGVEELNEDLIQEASDIDARQIAEDYVPHGKRVVRYMARNGGLLAFQARWRQHFLDSMNPQFLPAFWSVDFVPDGWTQQLRTGTINVAQ